jgi:hypothetical protein
MSEIDELQEKLKDRELRLLRAWAALEKVQSVLQRRTTPGAFAPEHRSFEEMGELLANGAEEEIAKRDRRFVNLIRASRAVFSWVGRAPKHEKEQAEMAELKKTFDLAICGIIEGEVFESFYVSQPQIVPKREDAPKASQSS